MSSCLAIPYAAHTTILFIPMCGKKPPCMSHTTTVLCPQGTACTHSYTHAHYTHTHTHTHICTHTRSHTHYSHTRSLYSHIHTGVAAGIAQATRDLMLTRGERYHAQMLQDKVIKDNRVKLRTYQDSFSGQDMVNWLIKKKEAQNTDAAIILGQALVDSGMMHHGEERERGRGGREGGREEGGGGEGEREISCFLTVNDKHQFKNTADILYRFRYDDKTYKGKLESSDVITRGIRVYCRLHGLFDPLLK